MHHSIRSFLNCFSGHRNELRPCSDPLLHGAGVRTGGALVARGSVGTRLGALAGPARTLAPAAAQQAQVGHAGVGASGAVTVVTLPVRRTLAEAAVTDAVA